MNALCDRWKVRKEALANLQPYRVLTPYLILSNGRTSSHKTKQTLLGTQCVQRLCNIVLVQLISVSCSLSKSHVSIDVELSQTITVLYLQQEC